MTIIAWDGKTLAADRKMSGSKTSSCNKLTEHNGYKLAVTGTLTRALAIQQWFIDGADPEKFTWKENDECTFITITPEGKVECYVNEPIPYKSTAPFEAWGSGADYARAAMYLGHDAIKAVEVASALDDGCGNGVDWL